MENYVAVTVSEIHR